MAPIAFHYLQIAMAGKRFLGFVMKWPLERPLK
jgi:hypothetical protein